VARRPLSARHGIHLVHRYVYAVCMSMLERRLQLLLDQERYERVAAEAKESGRSVNAVIREAIDAHYPPGAEARRAAMQRFLEMTAVPDPGPPEAWEDIKASLDEDFYGGKPWSTT
jgi:hypothetical protein